MFIILLLFHGLIVLTSIETNAQTSFSKNIYSTNNGLPYNVVQHITQDSTGFLWLSTWDGLSRYDGYEFKNYFHKPNDTNTFPFFIVEKTLVDKQNNVWVICPKRPLTSYNRQKNNFEQFKPDGQNVFGASDVVCGDGNDLWMLNELQNNIFRYNTQSKKMETFTMTFPNGQIPDFSNFLPKLIYDNTGSIWIICIYNGINEIYKTSFEEKQKVILKKIDPLPSHFIEPTSEQIKYSVYDIYVSENGTTWLFTNFGLFYIEPGKSKLIHFNEELLTEDFPGKPYYYWWSKKNGITVLDTEKDKLLHIKTDPDKHINSIFIDSQNNIWSADFLETYEETGLTRYIKTPDLFKHYLTEKNEFGNKHLIFPILKDKNNDLWVGTRGLDYIFKIKPGGEVVKTTFLNVFDGEVHPRVRTMVEDSAGIWMGCTENTLVNYNFEFNKFTPQVLKNDGNPISIHNILKQNNDLIINGLYETFRFTPVSGILDPKYIPATYEPKFTMVADGKGGFLQGSTGNLIVHLDAELNVTGKYRIGDGNTNVEHICPGDNNDIWIAMMGGGLGHLFLETDSFEIFTTADGLSNNTTYSILKDKNGNLWISTNKGISRFNPETKSFRTFGKAEGLMIEEFNSDSWFQSEDGEMFFGGVGGMISFYPDSVEKNLLMQEKDRLLITEFQVSGIPCYFDKPVYESDTIRLQKGDNNFQLTFACINFRNADNIKYRYRVSGKNNTWIETSHLRRNVNYTNLAPGKYNLRIEATNSSGQWNSSTDLQIVIPHYFYQTLLFKLLILFFIGGVIVAFVFLIVRQIRLVEIQKQDKLRLESLRGQMNPHFIFNSLNSINYFISNNDKISANSYIADFSRLIRAFLNNLSNEYVPFEKELDSLKDYLKLEHLRFRNKFDYALIAGKIEDKENIEVFPGMVQPFIENAIWHGVRSLENRKGFIRIEFIPVNESKIQCIIEDDGVGRNQAKLFQNKMPGKKSLGIGIVTERLRIVSKIMNKNYRLSITDAKTNLTNTGTLVIIDLPIK